MNRTCSPTSCSCDLNNDLITSIYKCDLDLLKTHLPTKNKRSRSRNSKLMSQTGSTDMLFDHLQTGVVYNFGGVCLSVCLYNDHYHKPWHRKFILSHPVYLDGILVKFIYKGHWVKVKVTGAKKVENPCSWNVNLRSAITLVLQHRETWRLGSRLWHIKWYECHLCHVTGSNHA